jgi:hypothetical protein
MEGVMSLKEAYDKQLMWCFLMEKWDTRNARDVLDKLANAIKEEDIAIADIDLRIHDCELIIKGIESETLGRVSSEGENGKYKYPNKELREAEVIVRCQKEPAWISTMDDLKTLRKDKSLHQADREWWANKRWEVSNRLKGYIAEVEAFMQQRKLEEECAIGEPWGELRQFAWDREMRERIKQRVEAVGKEVADEQISTS